MPRQRNVALLACAVSRIECVCPMANYGESHNRVGHEQTRRLPRRFAHTGNLAGECLETELMPTEAKFANDAAPTPGLRAAVLDGRWACIAAKGVQLELSLVPDLSGKRLVACNVEVRAASDLVRGDPAARLDVP